MKAIYLKRPWGLGYVEVTYRNHDNCEYRLFEADWRKTILTGRAKWKPTGEAGFGGRDSLCDERSALCGCRSDRKEHHRQQHRLVSSMLMEASRRYDQRYARFGELGNAQMPIDPEYEAYAAAISRMIDRNIDRTIRESTG